MKPPPFKYVRPPEMPHAVELLATYGGDAKPLAGGQSLIPLLNMRLARPELVIDLAHLDELQVMELTDRWLTVGAGVRQRAAEQSAIVRDACPLLAQALRHVGHQQIRNRGTVGGSLAHADPSAELPVVAVALDAELVAIGTDGERVIPACEFFLHPYTTALRDDELLTRVRFPVLPHTRTAFYEVARRSGDFAIAAVAAAIRLEGHVVAEARLSCSGTSIAPVRLDEAEASLVGAPLDLDAIDNAAAATSDQLARDGIQESEDDYRRSVVETLVFRALAGLSR